MTPVELLALLQAFYAETLKLAMDRQTSARSIGVYDANNVYQQVLGRQDVHLRWLSDAITDLGGPASETPAGNWDSAAKRDQLLQLIEGDVNAQTAFLGRWQDRVTHVTHARHRKMLALILGEMREHLRLLQQALEGRTDVLGRHTRGKVLSGTVLAGRPRG